MAGKVVAGGGGKCGKGRESVILAPQLWRGPITYRTEIASCGDAEAEKPNQRRCCSYQRGNFYQGDRVSVISVGDCERDVIARNERM